MKKLLIILLVFTLASCLYNPLEEGMHYTTNLLGVVTLTKEGIQTVVFNAMFLENAYSANNKDFNVVAQYLIDEVGKDKIKYSQKEIASTLNYFYDLGIYIDKEANSSTETFKLPSNFRGNFMKNNKVANDVMIIYNNLKNN